MPTSALTLIRGRADVGIPAGHAVGPYELKSPNPDLQTTSHSQLKKLQRLSSRPGITTNRKKAQLTRVKTFRNCLPRPGYART